MRFAGLCALLAALAALLPGRAAEPTKPELLQAIEKQLKAIHETAGPAVACVVVSRSELYPKPAKALQPGQLGGFDPKEFIKADPKPGREKLAESLDLSDRDTIPDHGFSGGVVIDAAGLVLANYHAVDGATKVYVHTPGGGGSYADVHAADARSDLAVLKLLTPPPNLKPMKIGEVRVSATSTTNATVFPGKLVVLLVNPYLSGFSRRDGPSQSLGSISNVRRRPVPPPTPENPQPKKLGPQRAVYDYARLLEHDVRLNAAVSGGALVNLDGELIGLTTTAAVPGGENGPNFALPIDTNSKRIIGVLARGEEVEYGFAGVTLVTEPPTPIKIGSVTRNGPAALAGVQPGDIIQRIDDLPAADYEDLLTHLGSATAGTQVKVTLAGRGEVQLTLAKFKHELPFIASVRPEPVFGLRIDYSSILAQTLGNVKLDFEGVPNGVAVRELLPDSPAAAKFKALGDNAKWLITRVDGEPVTTPAKFYDATKGKASVKLTVIDPTETPRREREVTLP